VLPGYMNGGLGYFKMPADQAEDLWGMGLNLIKSLTNTTS